jgi:hypothetical protein
LIVSHESQFSVLGCQFSAKAHGEGSQSAAATPSCNLAKFLHLQVFMVFDSI